MARISIPQGEGEDLYRLWSINPELAAPGAALSAAVYSSTIVPIRTRELMRIRIAEINNCRTCRETRVSDLDEHGISEDDYLNSANWATWPGYSPAERIAIEFADKFALDHLALDDAWFATARQHFTDEQLHGMSLMIGAWIAFGRMQTVFDVHLSCALRL